MQIEFTLPSLNIVLYDKSTKGGGYLPPVFSSFGLGNVNSIPVSCYGVKQCCFKKHIDVKDILK